MNNKVLLKLHNVDVNIHTKNILKGIDLAINKGSVHAIMGPNGSGKSTLAQTLIGHPNYTIKRGTITFLGKNITKTPIHQRAQKGLFLAFQHPCEIEGVTLHNLLYYSYNTLHHNIDISLRRERFKEILTKCLKKLSISKDFIHRSLNAGFSGGEKKQAELLQLMVLQPQLAILDEIDSGLDIDALKTICNAIESLRSDNPEMALLIITHYPRMFTYLIPDTIHLMNKGTITQSGPNILLKTIEQHGYKWLQ